MLKGDYKKLKFQSDSSPSIKVTVAIAVFNGEQYLEQAIKSILNQTYKNIELIIIDGASTDSTVQILKEYESEIFYWVSEPDNGIYDAWNKAVKIASGEWISFVGADDILLPNAIEEYMLHIKSLAPLQVEYVSSKIQIVSNDLRPLKLYGSFWAWRTFKTYMTVGHVGSLHHRSLFTKHGLFDTSYRIAADYEFLLRAKDKLKASFLDVVTVKMRAGGLSHSNLKVFDETYRAKVVTAERNPVLCGLEFYIAIFKFYFRKLTRN